MSVIDFDRANVQMQKVLAENTELQSEVADLENDKAILLEENHELRQENKALRVRLQQLMSARVDADAVG